MRIFFISLVLGILIPPAPWAQQQPLQRVLDQLDRAAANFSSAQASFDWDVYQKVVDEHDLQKGKVYFRRKSGQIEMAADITDPPPPKQVLFADNTVQLYQPKIDQVTVYNPGKDRAAMESFLVLGFGGSGRDMLKSFDVTYAGSEKIGNIETDKLSLVPKSDKIRNNFNQIVLWIDPQRCISIQQQFFTPSGDYRLVKYSDIHLNEKIPDSAFKLKTTGKTKVISPQG